jgi:D-tagatose-1,6-bisphosphate aldolase subunit GatZ/KbaZ
MHVKHPLKYIVEENRKGIPFGMYSACTANEIVIEAVLEKAKEDDDYALIEATANQVNQYGGYTGMKPADFVDFCYKIADRVGFPRYRLILGGDHLGPLTWVNKPEKEAMEESRILIRDYVKAGFTKIHLDTSMRVADDDPKSQLKTAVIAERSAELCAVAEETFAELKKNTDSLLMPPVYVIGSEVPIPGGAQEKEELHVTGVDDFKDTISTFKKIYEKHNLSDAWNRVIAIVVQPGVEFGDAEVHRYDRAAAADLSAALDDYPGIVFEGHSTDYQPPKLLKQMVEDGIAILKVGPALTFALREALFSLSHIEKELYADDPEVKCSEFIETLENKMVENPKNWNKHYHGNEKELKLSRKYSLSDRCRYYLPIEHVDQSISRLLTNLSRKEIPLTLISQYMPLEYNKIRDGIMENTVKNLLKNRVRSCIETYLFAVRPNVPV